MRTMPLLLAALLFSPAAGFSSDPPGAANGKKDYAEFSKLLHHFVASQAPKEVEHRDGWGQTIPFTERLVLPKLRTYLKDGDRIVLPHGAWKRVKVKLEDPKRDLIITVNNFKNIDGKTYRLELDADLVLRTEGEWQQWQKGLFLVGVEAVADAYVRVTVGSDVGVALNFKKIPPEVNINPNVTDLALDLQDIRLRGGPIFTGEKGEKLAGDIKGLLRAAVKAAEPQVKELANQAIAQSIKEGKGALSAGALLKALPPSSLQPEKR
jgi:hypothetical protein